MSIIIRILVALRLVAPVPGLLKQGRGFVLAMTGNPHFPTPVPALQAVSTALDSLEKAEVVAKSRAVGSKEARDVQKGIVRNLLQQLGQYVETVANLDPIQAAAIIESAGMATRKRSSRQRQVFEVRQGPVSGTVILLAAVAAKLANYDWQFSSDGKNWTSVDSTFKATTQISGLTPATAYWFRCRARTKKGQGDWCAAVPFLVK